MRLERSQKAWQALCLALVMVAGSEPVFADWPSLLGPTRDGKTDSSCRIPDKLPAALKPIWKIDAGQGYAGPVIAGSDMVTYERMGNTDLVRLLDANNGKEKWRRELPTSYQGRINNDHGPRCAPTILEESVLLFSAEGNLTLLSRKDGRVLWTRALRKDHGAPEGYFGAGSTPLVIGDRAIVNVGGKRASVVGVSLKDGSDLWSAFEGEASYASPILVTPERSPQIKQPIVVVPTRLRTLALDPETGKILWDFPFGQRGPTVNAATPIVTGQGDVFLTSSYNIGFVLIRPDLDSPKIVKSGLEMASQYASPVSIGNKIFGADGREDGDEPSYRCLRAEDGSVLWARDGLPICHTLASGNRLLLVGIDGHLWALESDKPDFEPLWESKLPKSLYRAIPAYTGNRLYTKTSTGTNDTWACFALE